MKIIIIGAQAAGASAAAKAKRIDPNATVRIYEKSEVVSFGACGLPYFIADEFQDPEEMISRTVSQFASSGIDIKTHHEVITIDALNKKVGVKNLQTNEIVEDKYDNLLLAQGASVALPPIDNLWLTNLFTLKSMSDGLALKEVLQTESVKNIIIVGAGYIGLELAEALVKIGKSVRIIQQESRVLFNTFDAEISNILEEELTSHCNLHLNESVQALLGQQRVEGVVTNKGSYSADAVILATGVKPNSTLYRDLGLNTLANGAIITDCYGRTSQEGIYAAGDCVALYHRASKRHMYTPLATGANKLGRIVGENMAGGHQAFPGTLATSALRVLTIEAARTGLTEQEAKQLFIPYKTVQIIDKNHSNYISGQKDVCVKLIYHAHTRELLGGQIAGGKGAALRVNALATAIWAKMQVDQLAMLDYLYAPPFSRPWDMLNIAGSIAN